MTGSPTVLQLQTCLNQLRFKIGCGLGRVELCRLCAGPGLIGTGVVGGVNLNISKTNHC